MRPVALLAVLCFTPVADACFLKCLFRCKNDSQPQSPAVTTIAVPVRLPTARIRTIAGHDASTNPTVPSGVPVSCDVRCSFDPRGHTPTHELNADVGSAPAPLMHLDVREFWIWDWYNWEFYVEYEFSYLLPELKPNTEYELRILINKIATFPIRKFKTL
jgi:hypothetical protein